jgi:outer membrane receptor for ferrienterochelin and colicin
VDWKEYLGRVYLYWTPYRWLSLSAEYHYEKFDRDKEFVAGIEEVKTHRFPLGINFSHPSGISAWLQATYYDQEGKFLPLHLPPGSSSIKGSDTFWVVDASISYRLPKRYGVITIGAKNLFDESFNYQDTDPANPLIQPEQFIFARFTLSL